MFKKAIAQLADQPFDSSNELAEAIIELIQDELVRNPEVIEELAPGLCLTDRTMSPDERARLSLPAANKARLSNAEKRKRAVVEEIQRALLANPAISLVGIADWLDRTELKPPRRPTWDPRAVRRIMKEYGL